MVKKLALLALVAGILSIPALAGRFQVNATDRYAHYDLTLAEKSVETLLRKDCRDQKGYIVGPIQFKCWVTDVVFHKCSASAVCEN